MLIGKVIGDIIATQKAPSHEERKILVADFATQNHEALRAMKKGNPPRAARLSPIARNGI